MITCRPIQSEPTPISAEQLHRDLAGRHPRRPRNRRQSGDRWVEVWECGLAGPDVLSAAGLTGWHGLACGIGLDRLLMPHQGNPRHPDAALRRPAGRRSNAQLSPYRPVSSHPAVRRDISVAVDKDDDADTLGDRVREALGADGTIVEEVAVLGETAYNRLPHAARDRLGAREGQ